MINKMIDVWMNKHPYSVSDYRLGNTKILEKAIQEIKDLMLQETIELIGLKHSDEDEIQIESVRSKNLISDNEKITQEITRDLRRKLDPVMNNNTNKMTYTPEEMTDILQNTCKILPNGSKYWLLNGKLHRLDGPAIEQADGRKEWWIDGKLHRVDGPAIEWPIGLKEWFQNGERHRVDGPAAEWADGDKEWWIDGIRLTEEEFNKRVKK